MRGLCEKVVWEGCMRGYGKDYMREWYERIV